MQRLRLEGVPPYRQTAVLDRITAADRDISVIFEDGKGTDVLGTLEVSELACPKNIATLFEKIGPAIASGVGPDPEIRLHAPGRPDAAEWTRGAFVGPAG